MNDWYLVLAPVAALAALALCRFVGCASLLGVEDWDVKGGPSPTQPEPGAADYHQTAGSDTPVWYWRLQEPSSAEPSPGPTVPNAPVSGGTAKDEQGINDGTYKAVMLQQPPPSPLPPDSPAAP